MRDQRESSRQNYIYYKEHGVCVSCGVNNAAPHRIRCEECLAKDAERHARIREDKGTPPQGKTAKERRERRKAAGLCIWCGKPICKSSTVFCIDCRIKNQRKNEKRKLGIRRSERVAYNMCYCCGASIEPGERLCAKCKERSINNLPEKAGVIESWKRDNNRVFHKKVAGD